VTVPLGQLDVAGDFVRSAEPFVDKHACQLSARRLEVAKLALQPVGEYAGLHVHVGRRQLRLAEHLPEPHLEEIGIDASPPALLDRLGQDGHGRVGHPGLSRSRVPAQGEQRRLAAGPFDRFREDRRLLEGVVDQLVVQLLAFRSKRPAAAS
jgi:hypothetical protein